MTFINFVSFDLIISKIDPEGLVAKDGRIQTGYTLLSLNGENVKQEKINKVLENLEKANGQVVLVVSKPTSATIENTEISPDSDRSFEPTVSSLEPSVSPLEPVPCDMSPPAVLNNVKVQSPGFNKPDLIQDLKDSVQIDQSSEVKVHSDIPVNSGPKEESTPVQSVPENENQILESQETSDSKKQVEENGLPIINNNNVGDERYGVFEVIMIKGVMGLGFLIEGGKGTPLGDLPLLIKRIIKGLLSLNYVSGPAEKCGELKVKDEILAINGEDVTNMKHKDAWNFLKFLDDGEVKLLIKREQS
ncbi:LOW QUALITY PROTEIN: hypothetical protein KUTeg_018273 [Tegillarca granosa]|uniref:PDZ domain-containing protein n=1 Tax=Tegillarca granosa TaxID=220873 RepID=A0ABQ9EMC8_TEGGR|nr:LOW QUALITY PROTEIN: hypothetical protein KUTeg_018273 [Tegillarca granosa]